MSSVFVCLEILAVALWLVAWFGVWACGAGVPLFDVEATGVAIIPICEMFGGIGIWCLSWLLAIIGGHLVVWWGYVAIGIIICRDIVGWGSVASSTALVASSLSCIAALSSSIVARLICGLYVLWGRYICQD